MSKVIVMGATSGIGREIAMMYLQHGYTVGVAGRRYELLDSIKESFPSQVYKRVIDVTSSNAQEELQKLIDDMNGVDIYIHCSGYGRQNADLKSDINDNTVETNVLGFTRMVDYMFAYFEQHRPGGYIAVISSIAGTKGLGIAATYSASKRYQWTYIEALSQLAHMRNVDIHFTDIRPGFVATDFLADGNYPMLLDKSYVAQKIIKSIKKKRHIIIIDWKYQILCMFWKFIPSCIWRSLNIRNK